MTTIKEFFKDHDHLRFTLQHLDIFDGGWEIRIYNTTYAFGVDPIYTHFIEDKEIDELNVDFDTAIMTPVINWWKTTLSYDEEKEKEKENKNDKVYLVYGNTYFDGYGAYLNTFGVFSTLEEAEKVKKQKEDEYFERESTVIYS